MKLTITNPQPYTVGIPGIGSVPALGTETHIVTEEQFRQFLPELNATMTRLGLTYTATAEPAELVITNLSATAVPFDPTGTDLTSTEVVSAIKEVYAAIGEGGGGGLTPITLTFTSSEIAGGSGTEQVTIPVDIAAGVVLSARLTRLAGTSNQARVCVIQQPGITPGSIDVIGGSMPDGDNLLTGVAYGPGTRDGDTVIAGTFRVCPVDGGLTVEMINQGWPEADVVTLKLELLVLPLDF